MAMILCCCDRLWYPPLSINFAMKAQRVTDRTFVALDRAFGGVLGAEVRAAKLKRVVPPARAVFSSWVR